MGTSTDAKLAWGVDLGEEIPAWLWKAFGAKPDEEGDVYPLTQALNAAGLDLEHHCSDSCTMYVLCVEESNHVAWRGHPKKIEALNVPAEWRQAWKQIEAAGSLPEPGWILFSWWG